MVAAVENKPSIEKYELLEEIGHGGMATVYRALDRRLAREVAIKIIHRHLRENQEVARRFVSEARAVAKLRHPNIVEVYDVSEVDDTERYLVVELVRGTTLRQLLSTHGHLPSEIAAAIALEIAGALDHAHGLGVIHRDVKPENVLVATPTPSSADERASDADVPLIKITDFGIAKLLDAQGVTSTGQVLGSPAHMAPEQIEGGDVSSRSDVFGMGVLLYESMVGRLPFDGKNPAQVLRRVLEGSFTPADKARPTVGARLAAIVGKALAHDPAARYADCCQLADALRAELQALGFTEPRRELRAFLLDPQGYTSEYEKRIVDRLIAVAEKARHERNVPLSASSLNRALAFRPDDAALLAEVTSLGRRERLRKNLRSAALAAGASMVVAAAAFAIVGASSAAFEPVVGSAARRAPLAPSARVEAPAAKSSARSAGAVLSSTIPRPEPPRSRRGSTAPGRSVPVSEVAKVRILVDGPRNATVLIDGIEQADWFSTKQLQVGRHTFEFRPPDNACCEGPDVQSVEITPSQGPDHIQPVVGHIKFRPAILEVRSPAGWTASCGELLGPNAPIPVSHSIQMPSAVLRGKCTLFPPPGSSEAPKEGIDVTLSPGRTSTIAR